MSRRRKDRRKRTTLRRNTWPMEEREEYDRILEKVVSCSKQTAVRLDLFDELLDVGIQAHRIWARDVERAVRRDGLGEEIRRYQNRLRAMLGWNGKVVNLPRVQGAKIRTEGGEMVDERGLIEMWPWDVIVEKRRATLQTIGSYNAKVGHYDRLLALRERCPDSSSPVDAAKRLKISLDVWLLGEGEAA